MRQTQEHGRVVMARAYANWAHYCIGADGLDALSWRTRLRCAEPSEHRTFVLMTGDVDFVALVRLLQGHGRRGGRIRDLWLDGEPSRGECDEFYHVDKPPRDGTGRGTEAETATLERGQRKRPERERRGTVNGQEGGTEAAAEDRKPPTEDGGTGSPGRRAGPWRIPDNGRVVMARAYGNWAHYCIGADGLDALGVELIHLPRGRARKSNAADIHLVADASEVCWTRPHIETFVLMTGDVDFVALCQIAARVRQTGRRIRHQRLHGEPFSSANATSTSTSTSPARRRETSARRRGDEGQERRKEHARRTEQPSRRGCAAKGKRRARHNEAWEMTFRPRHEGTLEGKGKQ